MYPGGTQHGVICRYAPVLLEFMAFNQCVAAVDRVQESSQPRACFELCSVVDCSDNAVGIRCI